MWSIYKNRVDERPRYLVRKLSHGMQNGAPSLCLDFSSNDYLGLSRNAQVLEAGYKAAKEYGVGATGSRLLSGNDLFVMEFESEIAKCKNTESALIFNSGFQCNAFVLASLLEQRTLKNQPLVFFDCLNHSSLYQAVFLSGAKLLRYRHNDYKHLSALLDEYANDARPKFIITETVFGMDGDVAPLMQIATLARKHDALLYLDEAHATGVAGQNGYGLAADVDWDGIVTVIMGTFSKAIGVSGAYVACDEDIAQYLVNFCSGFIYTTANSPFVIGAARKSWNLLPSLASGRDILREHSNYLREGIRQIGGDTGNSVTNIIPIIMDDAKVAKYVHEKLLNCGIKVSCIMPPTVPQGKARIRIALSIHHSKQDIMQLIDGLGEALSNVHEKRV